MARRASSPKGEARASHKPRGKRRLTSLMSSVAAKAFAAARSVASKRRASSRAASPSAEKSAKASPKPPFVPVKRVSVVRKPARGPSVRAAKPAARRKPAPNAPPVPAVRRRASVVSVAPPRHVRDGERDVMPSEAGSTQAERGTTAPAPTPEEQYLIPTGYGDTRILLMVKDPWWLYAYWEVQPEKERAARKQLLPNDVAGLQTVLRVYDVTGIEFPSQPAHRSFDIPLSGLAANWYIQTDAPGRSFIVEIGLLTAAGRFLLLARSNRVTAPRFGPAQADARWAVDDELFWKLFNLSAGVGIGSSPTAWAQMMGKPLSSAGWSPFPTARQTPVRGFWCRVNTDLVIHGAAEPRAHVVIQGQPATVRKDGTFSLRVTLPEGSQTITIEVTSADRTQTQTFAPTVSLGWTGSLTSPEAVQAAQPSGQGGAP